MASNINQRDNNNSQSTLDIENIRVFIGNNNYQTATFENNTGGNFTMEPYSLVVRDTGTPANVNPATVANLANVIGIIANPNSVELADTETTPVTYCYSGKIDETHLSLPATVTLDTTVGNKSLRDVLNGLGFSLEPSIHNFNYDN